MMTREAALAIVQRYAPDQADALLTETTVTRTVGGVPTELYDPYAAALAHLMNPDALAKSWRTERISEEFFDPTAMLKWLESQSQLLRLSWPAADPTGTALVFDLGLDVRGWNL